MTKEDRCLSCSYFDYTNGMCRKKMLMVVGNWKACNLYEEGESLIDYVRKAPNPHFRSYFDICDVGDIIFRRRR